MKKRVKKVKAYALVGVAGNLVWTQGRPIIFKKKQELWIYATRGLPCTITYKAPSPLTKRKRGE